MKRDSTWEGPTKRVNRVKMSSFGYDRLISYSFRSQYVKTDDATPREISSERKILRPYVMLTEIAPEE